MNEPINLEKLILDLVLSDTYQPLKPRAIAKKLKLIGDEKNVTRAIKKLVRQDRLAYGSKHFVVKSKASKTRTKKKEQDTSGSNSTSKSKSSNVVGTFRRASAGFGFVTPQDSTATDRSQDIFIPKQKTLDAADLDVVSVRLSREKSSKGASGRIVEVIDRHTHRFVGTYIESDGYGFVSVDGGVFESGILVGDAGAKSCKVDDKVVIEMVRFPSEKQEGEGVIVEVLGDRGTPGVDTLSVIRQFGLPDDFTESVMENAREQAEAFDDGAIPEGRRDFTTTTVITIDPKTARDFDDAISLERLENGHWELGVHIADVSHFVPYRSDLDNEAFQRGTSVYLPDRVIPMLPEIISNNLASLQPDRIRFCMTALIEFTDEGVPIGTELHRGAIKSAHRFNYEEIDEYLENDKPWKKKLTPEVFELVRNMHTLAMKLRGRRMDGGSINLVLPEVKIDLDDDGKVCGAHTVDNTESHQVIEEFMLAANEAVAQRLADEKLFLMRRVHPQPSEAKLTELTSFVKGLGIECGSLQDRFEMKRVIEESANLPQQHAIHYAVLRSMQKAIYSPEEIGHYALNSKSYCHFTSPIRRYPDLIIHRMVGDLIDGKRPDASFDRLASLGKHCSELEKRAADAERDLKKLKLLNFMSDKVGETMHAIITGVEAFGVFAQGIEIPAEGMIPVANLPADSYKYDRASRTLSGFREDNQFRLGDRIEVKVAVVDPDQRSLEFELAGVKPTPGNVARRTERTTHGNNSSNRKPKKEKPPTWSRSDGSKVERTKSDRPRAERSKGNESKGDEKPLRKKSGSKPGEWRRASGAQKGHRKKARKATGTTEVVKPKKKKSVSAKKKPTAAKPIASKTGTLKAKDKKNKNKQKKKSKAKIKKAKNVAKSKKKKKKRN